MALEVEAEAEARGAGGGGGAASSQRKETTDLLQDNVRQGADPTHLASSQPAGMDPWII